MFTILSFYVIQIFTIIIAVVLRFLQNVHNSRIVYHILSAMYFERIHKCVNRLGK